MAKTMRIKYFSQSKHIGKCVVILLKETSGRMVEDRRNHDMVLLALNTGLRRAELCYLKKADIHDGYVSVMNGKGSKARDVYIDTTTKKVILEYARVKNCPDSPYLFTTRAGKISPEYMGATLP